MRQVLYVVYIFFGLVYVPSQVFHRLFCFVSAEKKDNYDNDQYDFPAAWQIKHGGPPLLIYEILRQSPSLLRNYTVSVAIVQAWLKFCNHFDDFNSIRREYTEFALCGVCQDSLCR